jgi:hypothetical protein
MKNVLRSATILGILTTIAGSFGVPAVDPSATTLQLVLQIVGLLLALWGRWRKGDLRIGAAAPLLLAALVLTGCAGLTPSGLSPSTAGAPATATQGAQTIGGSQGQAPSTATGGTAAISWHFASSVKPETVNAILDLAREGKWTAEQVESAMRAAAGAPHTVNITTTGNTASGGNASSIPAAGGTAEPNAATGSGNATRP